MGDTADAAQIIIRPPLAVLNTTPEIFSFTRRNRCKRKVDLLELFLRLFGGPAVACRPLTVYPFSTRIAVFSAKH
jgi:hypothetical protein